MTFFSRYRLDPAVCTITVSVKLLLRPHLLNLHIVSGKHEVICDIAERYVYKNIGSQCRTGADTEAVRVYPPTGFDRVSLSNLRTYALANH